MARRELQRSQLDPPLCKDCKWFERRPLDGPGPAICHRYLTEHIEDDLINGRFLEVVPGDCGLLRMVDGACGTKGAGWERRPPEPPPASVPPPAKPQGLRAIFEAIIKQLRDRG